MKTRLITLAILLSLGQITYGQTKKIAMKSRSASSLTKDLSTWDNFGLGCRQILMKAKTDSINDVEYDICFCTGIPEIIETIDSLSLVPDTLNMDTLFVPETIIPQTENNKTVIMDVCPFEPLGTYGPPNGERPPPPNAAKTKKDSSFSTAFLYLFLLTFLFGLTKVEFK